MSNSLAAELAGAGWNLEHSYAQLPAVLFERGAAAFRAPALTVVNHRLARELGLSLERVSEPSLAALFTGQAFPPGAEPIAQAYAGHQFGHFTMLGDGRALLWGEQRTPDGGLRDLQFKGSGQTPYSRRGDGKAALGPMLREHIISEAMHALGIPTTRSLAVAATGEPVFRERPLQGAVLTRVADSHIRVGTFQFLAAQRDDVALKQLADYTIARHFPDLAGQPQPYLALLQAVIERQAALIARWQLVGFVHGVMNTDNMAICGETIDYGPCAFMDTYHPATVFSSIDHDGRYAYGNQPSIGQWNLARFAETLLPLLDPDQPRAVELAVERLNAYVEQFGRRWLSGMRSKLGLEGEEDEDRELAESLLEWMEQAKADFTNTFDDLSQEQVVAGEPPAGELYGAQPFQAWLGRWRARVQRGGRVQPGAVAERMRRSNPAVIPRNHRVEEALTAAVQGDLSVMQRLLEALCSPWQRNATTAAYRSPPPPGACYRTFCGT